jgi:hydrogenase maturation protease
MKTLLLGLGNPILSDDSVGIRLAREIGASLAGEPELDVLSECTAGWLDLLEVLAGYQRLIVLDSIRTSGGIPGRWHRFDARSLRKTRHLSGIHDANFATALELGRRMKESLPPDEEIHLFAVEIEEGGTFGEFLSPLLVEAYPRIRREIARGIRALLRSSGAPTRRRRRSGKEGSRS